MKSETWDEWVSTGTVTLQKTRELLRILKGLTSLTSDNQPTAIVSEIKMNLRETSMWFQEKPISLAARSLYRSTVRSLGHQLQKAKFKKSQKRLISRFSITLQPLLMTEMTTSFFSAHSQAYEAVSHFLLSNWESALEALQDDTKLTFQFKRWLLANRLLPNMQKS